MGLSDDLYMIGAMADLTKCAHGHNLVGFQTKSLECSMVTYYVSNRQLFKEQKNRRRRWDLTDKRFEIAGDGALKVIDETYAHPDNYTGEVVMYTHCEICQPVFYEAEWRNEVESRTPFCEFALIFKKGELDSAEQIKVETRDNVREKLLKAATFPLPDDDRVVQRELKKWREENNL